jgi:sulfotransferase
MLSDNPINPTQGNISMVDKIHFISGLPRSGSTLLGALLRQNPRFSAAVTSPVFMLCGALVEKMSGAGEFAPFFTDDRRQALLRGVVDAYYAHVGAGQVVFDTNRLWTGKTAFLKDLYPQARIICCVREVGWIIDSLERMLRKNPLQMSRIFAYKPGSSIYERVETLMNSETGLIGLAWSGLREAWFSENAGRLILINYDNLVRQPESIMRRLYEELQEDPFIHDFDHVAYDDPDYDAGLGMPGLHKVREKVAYQKRELCIPPDIFARYADTNFWLMPEANRRGVRVL